MYLALKKKALEKLKRKFDTGSALAKQKLP